MLKLEIDAHSSTWVGCLESSWCKWFAGLCYGPEAAAFALKLVHSSAAAAVGQSIAVVGLDTTKLALVGAAVAAAGWCSTSKLGCCALSSSICRTIALFLEAAASPCLCWLEAGEGKLLLVLWPVCLFLFLSLLFLFLSFASFVRLLLVVRVWLLAFPFAPSFLLVSPRLGVQALSHTLFKLDSLCT